MFIHIFYFSFHYFKNLYYWEKYSNKNNKEEILSFYGSSPSEIIATKYSEELIYNFENCKIDYVIQNDFISLKTKYSNSCGYLVYKLASKEQLNLTK